MSTEVQMNAFQKQLAALEEEISRLSASNTSTEGFFRLFLEQTVAVLGVGGGIWQIKADNQWESVCHMNLQTAGIEEQGPQSQLLISSVGRVIETAAPVVLPGNQASNVYDGGLGEAATNKSVHSLLFVPIVVSEKVAALIVLISPEDVDPRAVRGYLGFVMGLCEKAGAFLQNKRIAELEAQLGRGDRVRQYVSALHSSLDPRRTCYALANYGQELLGVYRCMAGTFNSRGKFRMESVSGLESVAVKSNFIKSISQIARKVCRNDNILLVDNPEAAHSADEADDSLITAARLYMLGADSTILGVFPIRWEKQVVGALVVEKAKEEPIDQAQRQQIEALLVEAGSALSHSLTYRNLPLSLLTRPIGAIRDRIYRLDWMRRAVWAAILLLVFALPFLITKQVKVIGTAELVPVEARIAYTPRDGVIDSVSIPEDRQVKAGQVLASLDTKLIDSEIDRLNNEIAQNDLLLSEEIHKNGRTPVAAVYESGLEALRAELRKNRLEREKYQITSAVDGRVITTDSVLRQLLSRPVSRGEALIEIVPADSEWQLSVNIPEDEAGALLKAYDDPKRVKPLQAKVILNAYPDMKLWTKVLSVAPRAYVLSSGEQKYRNVIEVRVALSPDFKENPRQGMKGKVAIMCGRRSFFYVVTHEFVDFLRINLF